MHDIDLLLRLRGHQVVAQGNLLTLARLQYRVCQRNVGDHHPRIIRTVLADHLAGALLLLVIDIVSDSGANDSANDGAGHRIIQTATQQATEKADGGPTHGPLGGI
jgi:hypothetical protein